MIRPSRSAIASARIAASFIVRTFPPDQILSALEALEFECDGRFLTLNSYENRVYQVGIEDERPVVAKFYRPGRWTEEQLHEEHRFSRQLFEAEIPVVAPLYNAAGDCVHRWNGLLYTLFPRRGGHAPDFDNPDNLLVLGRTLGRIHAVGATEPFRVHATH